MVLYNDDCYNVIKKIPDNTIDLVYIDIPYLCKNMFSGGGSIKNFTAFKEDEGTKRQETRKNTFKELATMMNGIDYSIFDELCRVLKHINMYIWCSKEQMLDIMSYFIKVKKCNFDLLVWCKTNPTPFCHNTFLPDVEYCFCFREKGCKLNDGYKLKSKYYVSALNLKDKKKYKHPTIKPLELVKRHILHSTNKGDTVLDCFMGSGTTGVACKELNREFIGIELNKDYFEIAKKRIEETMEGGEK